MELPMRVKIPSGCVQPRLVCGVPLEAVLLLVLLIAVPYLALRIWQVIFLVPVVWGFFKFQSRRDPQFLSVWKGQMSFAKIYYG